MSLKAFHFIFIFFSIALALGVGMWCVYIRMIEGTPGYALGAIASFAAAVAFLVYGIWFYRKMKRLGLIT